MKLKHTDRVSVALTQAALAKVDRNQMLEAKYGGLEFTRPEHKEPVNLIERPRIVEPMKFSLASLLPAGV